ncbi:hypothetical protein [Luteolibacter luteus]|uniref:Uncharacterized protein n=1 Tax=Luteolibacter luteus TaxID=2728835 RepID=A0A858RGQ4_9BACT|nr:hypothetical protein [Luteolibacter luteus]QJE95972.1 hypothetical protein HHL09_09320 [Luteolibacter luteus]
MKPRPLYRSITFWSGVFVMSFLFWGSWLSQGMYRSLAYDPYAVASADGVLHISRSPGYSSGDRWSTTRFPSVKTWERFPPPLFLRGKGEPVSSPEPPRLFREIAKVAMSGQSPGAWVLAIPHWLIIFAAGLSWSVLLLWRARRTKKANEGVESWLWPKER